MLMGANLVMLAQLGMSPGLDRQVLGRGRSMMAPGKQGLQQILADPGMEEALPEDGGAPPSMDYVRQLTAAMVQVADTLDQVQLREPDPDSTAMHYFNILISQALAIALEGSSLIVTEQGNMAEPHRNTENFERGKTMLTDARTMIIQVMGSRSMTEMHSRGAGKMAAMSFTHKLMGDALKVLDLLDRLAR
jgi:hypothetical protein